MSENRHQHFVPVQMIRRFANPAGRLFCLRKRDLCVPEAQHGVTPRRILYRNRYYSTDLFPDFDEKVIQPIETRFGAVYSEVVESKFVDASPLPPRVSSALLDWVILQLCRTRLIEESLQLIPQSEVREHPIDRGDRASLVQLLRIHLFRELHRIYHASDVQVARYAVPAGRELILPDHPVLAPHIADLAGFSLLVPLSKHKFLLLGREKHLIDHRHKIDEMNDRLAGWAGDEIYSGSLNELKRVASQLTSIRNGESKHHQRASLPFFGLLEDIKEILAADNSSTLLDALVIAHAQEFYLRKSSGDFARHRIASHVTASGLTNERQDDLVEFIVDRVNRKIDGRKSND